MIKAILFTSAATAISLALFLNPLAPGAKGAEPIASDETQVNTILRDYCSRCHGPQKQSGDLRLDQLSRNFVSGGAADMWQEVLDRVAVGDMPPKNEKPLSAEQRQALTTWLRSGLAAAAEAKRSAGRAVMLRRLTKEEYQHTMEDLLGLRVDYISNLPPDPPSKDGFLNNGETMLMSASQMETYLEVAQRALDQSFNTKVAAKPLHYFISSKALRDGQSGKSGPKVPTGYEPNTAIRFKGGTGAFPVSPLKPDDFQSARAAKAKNFDPLNIEPGYRQIYGMLEWPVDGELLVRIRAASSIGKTAMTVSLGCRASAEVLNFRPIGSALVGEMDVFEFKARMDSVPVVPTNTKSKFNEEMVFISNESVSAELLLDSVEITTVPANPLSQHPVLAGTPEATLRKFVPKAWRRPVSEREIRNLMGLHDRITQTTPDTALRDTLAVVLSSVNFLYLLEPRPGVNQSAVLTEHELAARLSYFLWNTTPDDELRKLADAGQLSKQLNAQFTRMLNDKRSDRFVRSFVYQWLDLGGLERVAVNPEYFPSYSDALKTDSANESYAFFDHLLRHDLPATKFLASEFITVNDRMAQYYSIKNVMGSEFRAVPAPPHRGGLLTQASILTANSNGVDSHPIKRGTWILLRLLNDPPPPPPPNVPILDDAKAQAQGLTIAQQLAEHRHNPACADCHQKIDPWGLSLENFNAIGLWRDNHSKLSTSPPAAQKPSKKRKKDKAAVSNVAEENAETSSTQTSESAAVSKTPVEELQQRLLTERGDDFARAFVGKLLTYALGRNLDFADTKAVDELTAGFQADKYNIRLLMTKIVLSKSFQRRN